MEYVFFSLKEHLAGLCGIQHIKKHASWFRVSPIPCLWRSFSLNLQTWHYYMQHKYNITMTVIPLCQYHAWSLCDSHGGVIKLKMKRAEIRDEVPSTTEMMKAMLEGEIDRTFVYAQDRIPVGIIDRELYARFGGFAKVGPVPGLGDVGHISYPKFGHVLTRRRPGHPDSVELRFIIPDNVQAPTWHYFNQLTSEIDNNCKQCSMLHMRPIPKHICMLVPRHQSRIGKKQRQRFRDNALELTSGEDDVVEESDVEADMPTRGGPVLQSAREPGAAGNDKDEVTVVQETVAPVFPVPRAPPPRGRNSKPVRPATSPARPAMAEINSGLPGPLHQSPRRRNTSLVSPPTSTRPRRSRTPSRASLESRASENIWEDFADD